MNELSDLLGSLLGGSTEGPAEGMDGLLDLLGGLVSTEPAEKKEKAKEHASGMPDLEKMMEIVSRLQADDKNIRLLRALQPHLTPDRAARVDDVIQVMRLLNLMPLLQLSGGQEKPPDKREEKQHGPME